MPKKWTDEVRSHWKFGLILVAIEDEGTDYESEVCELVELYPLGDNGEYNAWCKARLGSLEELENAYKDVKRDGVNRYFYDNGTFKWEWEDGHGWWDWTPNDSSKDSAGMVSDTIAKINLKQKYNNSGEQ